MNSVFAAVGNQSSSDFFIQLDEPNRVYFPGDEIRGVVLIRSSKRIRSSSIRLRFKGKVTTNARESRMFRVFDNSVPVDELEKVGYTPHQRFAFMANLPQGTLPSIYSFNGGSISYTFKATLHSSWLPEKLSKRCAVSVNVLDRIDIQAYPAPVIRPFQTEVKVKKKKTKGIAFVDVLVGKGAVLQGKSWGSIPIRIHIKHVAPIKNLQGVMVGFYRMTGFVMKDGREERHPKELLSTVSPILIDPDTLETNISTKITVPKDISPTISNAKIVSISYYVEIIVDLTAKTTIYETSSRSKKKLGKSHGRFEVPIVVGTIDSNLTSPRRTSVRRSSIQLPIRGRPQQNNVLPNEWASNSAVSLNDPLLALPPSPPYRHSRAISWTGSVSPVPSAPSVEELGYYEDFEVQFNPKNQAEVTGVAFDDCYSESDGKPSRIDTFSTVSSSSTYVSPSSPETPVAPFVPTRCSTPQQIRKARFSQ